MDGAKPGHTVRFQGLRGAAHLNGTEGTLLDTYRMRDDGVYDVIRMVQL